MHRILILSIILLLPLGICSKPSQDIIDFRSKIDDSQNPTYLINKINNKMSEAINNDDLSYLYLVRATIYENNGNTELCIRDLKKAIDIAEDPYQKEYIGDRLEGTPISHKYKYVTSENYQEILLNNKNEDDIAGILLVPISLMSANQFDSAKKMFEFYKAHVKTPNTLADKLFGLWYMRICEDRNNQNTVTEDFQTIPDFLDAIEYYDTTNNLVKDSKKYKYIKARIYYYGRLQEEALNLLEKMEEEGILNEEGYLYLGYIYQDKDNISKAKEYFEKGINVKYPNYYHPKHFEACQKALNKLNATAESEKK